MNKETTMKSAAKLIPAILAVSLASLPAKDIYVSVQGTDSNSGTKTEPYKTLSKAKQSASQYAGKESVSVIVGPGVYYLKDTLVFGPSDSGTEKFPVVYKSAKEGGAVISGGAKLDLKWSEYKDGIFKASTAKGVNIDQLFINGENQRMARYPNYDPAKKTAAYQGFAADAISKNKADEWGAPKGAYLHAMHKANWGGYHYLITGKDSAGELTYEGGWQNNRLFPMHEEFRMVENVFEELDAPGEWFHNAEENTLYYKPEAGADLAKSTVEIVRLNHLVEFQGSIDKPVKHITFDGFVVRHASRTFMDTKEPLLRSDWTIYRGGAFLLTGTENISVLNSEFDQVGGNAIFVNKYNRKTLVKGCHIHDVGASGVCFVGSPDAVHNPLFEYAEKNDLATISLTAGPKTEDFPSLGVVEDCLIHGIGRVERQPAGVQMSMSMNITVRDTSIYDCSRSGINISEGTWGGHMIERCDVFDTVLETHDHGSFNSWGRDRFWRSDVKPTIEAVAKNPKLPFLDAHKTTVIRNSRWRCDHGWDIDLDDGSSNYDVYNNLMLSRGLKLREGYRRRVWNNIAVNNGVHPHVWYPNSGDEVFSNIWMTDAKGARMPTYTVQGKRVDSNLFYSQNDNAKNKYSEYGWDAKSITADPLFIDPANGDFRVKDGSPAFDIGFKNFPMDQFGVKKPSLKAIAREPEIPELKVTAARSPRQPSADKQWLGATIHELQGREFSAYGVPQHKGGIALLKIDPKSPLIKAGFQEGDLIIRIGDGNTPNMDRFDSKLKKIESAEAIYAVMRHQKKIKISFAVSGE